MEIDLKSMTRKELKKLLADVKKALTAAQARDRREARKAAEKAAAEFGFSLNDLSEAPVKPQKKPKSKPRRAARAQFANPANPMQTWTGKGRQPQWYKDEIAAGKTRDDLKI